VSKPFPADNPFFRGYYAPVIAESDAPHLPVTGEMPAGLAGTLYRNGPNPQFAPRGPHHWFAGDGMIHAFRIAGGRVSYRNRWVRTPKWVLEHAEGEGLSGAFGNPAFSDPRIVALDSTVANTHVVPFAGRLLALEEQHAPFAIDPDSLAPVGYETFGDALCGPVTAHPKVDPVTGEMVFFGYSARGRFSPWASIQMADASGRIVRAEQLELPFASMVHDFAVTRHWIVLPIFPLTGSMQRARGGLPPYAWEPDKGTRIALIPRNAPVSATRWFDAPPCYVFHPMNHFEDAAGRIVVDVMKYDVAPLFPRPDGSPSTPSAPPARLFRWTIDPNADSLGIAETQLDDRAGEFPRFDERHCMAPYRHGWYVAGDVGAPREAAGRADGLVHYDFATGRAQAWMPPAGDRCGEPVFVPRAPDAAEGDGWLLCTLYRGAENRSDLAVFAATDIGHGPVALAHLSSRVPAGFHGSWCASQPS
jgi:carotenoid cleavage dioxygenase